MYGIMFILEFQNYHSAALSQRRISTLDVFALEQYIALCRGYM